MNTDGGPTVLVIPKIVAGGHLFVCQKLFYAYVVYCG